MQIREQAVKDTNPFIQALLRDISTRQQRIILTLSDLSHADLVGVKAILSSFDAVFETVDTEIICILQLVTLPTFKARISRLALDDQAVQQLDEIIARHRIVWRAGRFTFNLTEQPIIYGILNVTPDSFYDGGQFWDAESAVTQVQKMVAEGANVIEVGGQTTRPGGFVEVPVDEEIRRITPSIKLIKERFPTVAIAVDTYKYGVMEAAVELGVDIINDVNAFTDEPAKLTLMAASNVGLLTMHSSRDTEYDDLTTEMVKFFEHNLAQLTNAGIDLERVALDQGIGYAKVADGYQDYAMMRNIDQLNRFQRPIIVAISRKGFGAKLFGLEKQDRLPVTLIAETFMYLHGGRILRVHDVAETAQLTKMIDTINTAFWTRDSQ